MVLPFLQCLNLTCRRSVQSCVIYTTPHHRSIITQQHVIPWYSSWYRTPNKNKKQEGVPGWISNSRMSTFYTNFSIRTPKFLIFSCKKSACFIYQRAPSISRHPATHDTLGQYRTPNKNSKKQERWPRLDFFSDNRCVLHNSSRISCIFPQISACVS